MSALAQRIVSEIESATEPILSEVLDFVLFVKARGGAVHASDRISRSPGVCGGEACIGMTRIAVWMLESARRSGAGDLDLLKDYPGLNVYDLDAAWDFVAKNPGEIERAIRANREA